MKGTRGWPMRRTAWARPSACTLAGVLLIALAAATAQAQPPRPHVKFRVYPTEVFLDTLVSSRDTVAAPAAQVFAAVRAAYAALKIPRDLADSANGQLGTLRMRASNALGGELLSTYFNCGQGITGPNADQWRLQLAVVTFVQPAGEGRSRLGTGVAAEAQDMSGVSTAPAMCGSSGLLEARILKEVRARLAAP